MKGRLTSHETNLRGNIIDLEITRNIVIDYSLKDQASWGSHLKPNNKLDIHENTGNEQIENRKELKHLLKIKLEDIDLKMTVG